MSAVPAAPGRWWRRPVAVDAPLAAGVAGMAAVGVWQEMAAAPRPVPVAWPGYVIAVGVGVALVWRRTLPGPSALTIFALCLAYHVAGYPGWAPAVALFVAVYSLAAYAVAPQWLAAAFALCGLGYVVPLLPPHGVPWDSPAVWGPAAGLLWVALLAISVRSGRAHAEDRIRSAAALAATQAQQRMVEDRLRIARELHDVLAHTISVITVQGGLALDALEDDPTTARAALRTIRAASRQALDELRATLGLLREDGTRDTLPQPGLADLPYLVSGAQAAGVRVDLDGDLPAARGPDADGAAVPPAVELTAYRVVQEALTNVLRHAHARHATVTVARESGALVVQVVDDGRSAAGGEADGTRSEAASGSGFGLTGMRERTEALGGTFRAGARAAGGFEVRAAFPLRDEGAGRPGRSGES